MSVARGRSFRVVRGAFTLAIVIAPCAAWSEDGLGCGPTGAAPPRREDPAIRRALSLLRLPAPPTVEVVEIDDLPDPLPRLVDGACAFVQKGVPRIRVNSSCPVYRAATESLLEAMKLAAILRHEMAHLEGADERRAHEVEARAFRELLRAAPTYLLMRGFRYATELERRAKATPPATTVIRAEP